MSERYKIGEGAIPHFITCTVVAWLDVFSRETYKEIILDSLKYCVREKGLRIHAWVIMPNHVHLLVSSETQLISGIIRDFKKYTSRQIIESMQADPRESRREIMLNTFEFIGRRNKHNSKYQFWQQGYHPVELNTNEKLEQRIHYLHNNPVKAGIVWEPMNYKYSSAIDYYSEDPGVLFIEKI
jgi:REP element-mobilizing transposase RayT